jgi:hypothetical protein
MTYCSICYLETLQVLLWNLCSSGRNIGDVTAKQMYGAVPIFDLLLYEKYFPQKIFLLLFRNVHFRESKAVSSRYQKATFCGEHRLA